MAHNIPHEGVFRHITSNGRPCEVCDTARISRTIDDRWNIDYYLRGIYKERLTRSNADMAMLWQKTKYVPLYPETLYLPSGA